MKDFIYSVTINRNNPLANGFTVKFGHHGDIYSLLTIDIENRLVSFGNNVKNDIKNESFVFVDDRDYNIKLMVNDANAKLYIDGSDTALLSLHIEEYEDGEISDDLSSSSLSYSHRNITSLNTLSGDIFCNGYTVNKVINLDDGNYKLSAEQYTINGGILSINQSYLNTLENGTTYKFRAVTSFTDLDFYVATKEVGAQVRSLVDKYYRGDDIKFELSENVTVNKAVVDEKEYVFEQNNEVVTIKNSDLSSLGSGEHTIKLFTSNGRPEAEFSYYEAVQTLPEVVKPASHVFFFIDIAIFAALIIGYVAYSQIKKRNK